MTSDIPIGWVHSTIGEVTLDTQQRRPQPMEAFTYVDISSVDRNTKQITSANRILGENAPSRARKVIATGDVLVSMTRPNLNAVAIVPGSLDQQIASTGFDVLRTAIIDPRWLFYLVRSTNFISSMSDLVQGALYPAIKSQDIRSYNFLLAPLNEQKRIADKLDVLLARVDASRAHLERVQEILKDFRQSVLAAAVSGRLTAEWREENGGLASWNKVQLSEVATSRLGKMLDKAKNLGEYKPYLRNLNVRWFSFNLDDIQHIRITEAETQKYSVCNGDVLVCEGGEPGRCAVWRGENDVYAFQKALHRIRVGEKITPEWVCYCLKVSADSGRLSDYFTGTTIKHFTGTSIKQYKLDLPTLEEQYEIIKRVEILFAYADRLEARVQAALSQVENLTPSLLDKAFRGELVPQDPNDEPASVLLERIRVEREAGKKKTGQSRKPVRKVK